MVQALKPNLMCAKILIFLITPVKEILLNFYLRANIRRLLFIANNIDQAYVMLSQLIRRDTFRNVSVVLLNNKQLLYISKIFFYRHAIFTKICLSK